ncbi:hypothetical protein V6N11_055712 [Hibiscus sabdariffa]|uniref:Putative plant transposon protein domain-containing protein n=1 Tax=Hibiscus sabdariffa TaxID=183260 RepID=A0ABR2NH89_9ROSI
MASARYALVAARSRWEEQGFHFDDNLPNYGLEQFLYNRLNELGWFRLARQPARANYNWVIEFYANNAAGEDISTVRGRRVSATATIINDILGLPNDEPSFYAMLGGFEEEDYEVIKDFLCLPHTEWNTTGRNPNSVSRPNLLPEAKLWNTRAAIPTFDGDKYQPEKTGWTRAVYMRKMDLADAIPINVAMPTPPANPTPVAATPADATGPSAPAALAEQQHTSPPVIPVSSQTTTNSPATTLAASAERNRDKTPDTPLGSTPSSSPSPPAPAQTEEAAPPLHIMQLRSSLQRNEARQITFQEEIKVFNANLLKFLHFQFPAAARFFAQPSATPPQPNVSAAAQPSATAPAKEGATEEVHLSSDDENDVFDWQSPPPTPTTSAIAERSTPNSPTRRKGKAKAGRIFGREIPSSPDEEAEQRPPKRRRKYHVITAESDEDDSTTEIPIARPEQSADPSLSPSI